MSGQFEVLIVGAGAVGLTLACDLQRRGVRYRLVDADAGGFPGSRAKGVQPRTLEVFDDLGVLPRLEAGSMLYPPLGLHLGPITVKRTMIKLRSATPDVPHANTLLVPQYTTDVALRDRLEELGGQVEQRTRLASLSQHDAGVTATLDKDGAMETVQARYLVGADGGGSTVRKQIGIAFTGSTDESDRMIVADVTATGVSRDRWHIWPWTKGRFVALCPLPGDTFQLMLKLRPHDSAELSTEAIDRMVRGAIGGARVQIDAVHWSSVWRPNIRLAEHYRVGSVFLAGDAAHVHPPTGGQGLNTGAQDAYNLGWKLGQVLAGAPDDLLDSYEDERQPVAAKVLGLATGLYAHLGDRPVAATRRGDEERQLTVTYRGGPLAPNPGPEVIAAGDRAPDSPVVTDDGSRKTLFDLFRGPQFTLIAVSSGMAVAARAVEWPASGASVSVVELDPSGNDDFARIYGVAGPAAILVRPDGYIGGRTDDADAIRAWRSLPIFPTAAH